jgi:hypothetical protein
MNVIELTGRAIRIERAIKRLIRCFIGGALVMSGSLYLHLPHWVAYFLVALIGFALGVRDPNGSKY